MQTVGTLSERDRSQLQRKELARGAWRQGDPDNALLILDCVLAEKMSDPVAAECWTARASFQAEIAKYEESLETLKIAEPFIDSADFMVQGAFYYQRAKDHKELGHIDAAIMDYSGAAVYLGLAGITDREATSYNSLACLYLEIGDVERARENIDRAFEIRFEGSEYECQIYDTLAQVECAEGRFGQALRSAGRALELVGENELWKNDFLATREKIEHETLQALELKTIPDVERIRDGLDRIRADLTRDALLQTNGNLKQSAQILGLSTHKSVDWIIQKHPELEQYRKQRTTRRKSIIPNVKKRKLV
jgi:tetratricopeptide (TPR) repeat protein